MSTVHRDNQIRKSHWIYVFSPFSCLFYSSRYSRACSDGNEINKKELSWDKVIILNPVLNI